MSELGYNQTRESSDVQQAQPYQKLLNKMYNNPCLGSAANPYDAYNNQP